MNSPTLREDLEDCCQMAKIQPMKMLRDVSTRWNSTAEMIQRALQLAPALKMLVIKAEHNKPGRGVRLARFKLSLDEWQLLADLSPLLDVQILLSSLNKQLIISARFSSMRQRKYPSRRSPSFIKLSLTLTASRLRSRTTLTRPHFPSSSDTQLYEGIIC